MKAITSIWAGKLAKALSTLKGGSGSAIPGVVGLKIDPNVLQYLGKQVKKVIFVTGTNGKTTTSSLISQMFKEEGYKVLTNAEGANMITGVTAAMINQSSILGKLSYDIAVLEVDEASLPKIAQQIQPNHIIVTNFFRDQLDRYGEIDVLISHMSKSIQNSGAKLILNTDDPFVMRFDELGLEANYFGIEKGAYAFSPYGMSESKYCPRCQSELVYDTIHYGQLGIYSCACGFARKTPTYPLHTIQEIENGYQMVTREQTYNLQLQGSYNVYNAMAAITCAKAYGLSDVSIQNALSNYKSGNGRMQDMMIEGKKVTVNLIKNPAGANATLSEIQRNQKEKQVVIFLNDLAADGKDISWIWDVDFEKLRDTPLYRVICAGRRAEDMALRLKYAGIAEEQIEIETNVEKSIDRALEANIPSYFIPTYTNLEVVTKYIKGISA